jgi:hypothetical protein
MASVVAFTPAPGIFRFDFITYPPRGFYYFLNSLIERRFQAASSNLAMQKLIRAPVIFCWYKSTSSKQ